MTKGQHLILIIEDEQPIRRFLRASLQDANYRVIDAKTGSEGVEAARHSTPDLIILDLGLPDMNGLIVLENLRAWYPGPVIILSARDEERQKIQALDEGADDYITKPFGVGELLARIRVALRHAHSVDGESTTLKFGDLVVDLEARTVRVRNEAVHLTPLEYKLLVTMMKHAGKVLTHRYLLREVWGPENSQENHYLRVFVAGLRRKIEVDSARPIHILTEQGVGYRFAEA